MTLEQYISAVRAGELFVMGGRLVGDALVEMPGQLDVSDIEAVTAEAFNQGVFDSEVTTWEQASQQVRAALGA